MYTKDDCPNCMRAKMLFLHCPVYVEVVEKNIDRNEEYKKQLEFNHGSYIVPTFVFGNGHVERGFNEGKIMEVLGL